MTYTSKPAPDLTDDEVKACISLSLRGNGSMMSDLRWFREKPKRQSRVTMVRDDDGRLLAWSLQSKNTGEDWTFQVYVRSTHRRRGLGSSLLARARMGKRKPILVYPHSDESTALYRRTLASGRALDDWN